MSEWISTDEHKPEPYVNVIVAIYGHDMVIQEPGENLADALARTQKTVRYTTVGHLDEEGFWNGSDGYPMMVRPRFWMPMPEPPEPPET